MGLAETAVMLQSHTARLPLRILLCCEFYAPSVGGVQEVMRQLAERLVVRGHSVTVATSYLPDRQQTVLNGVRIREFRIVGNKVRGMSGEIAAYQQFVVEGRFDVVMIKAAQQWTFDALWPVLSRIPAAKVFIPCGFSALHEPAYREYFQRLPDVLRQFDRLIFYATEYRDVAFVREHGMKNLVFFTNGASEVEFAAGRGEEFRVRHGIAEDEMFFMTVGSPPWQKGQLEVAQAFELLDLKGQSATLLLNGHWQFEQQTGTPSRWRAVLKDDWGVLREHGIVPCIKVILKRWMITLHLHPVLRWLGYRAEPPQVGWIHEWITTYREYGWVRATKNAMKPPLLALGFAPLLRVLGYEVEFQPPAALHSIVKRIARQSSRKRVWIDNLSRPELVQAFFAADVFLFASRVEYSPLVLFEAAAAGTPFLSVPVGNAEEIAKWTGAGVICPASQDSRGYTIADPSIFADQWKRLLEDEALRKQLGEEGRRRWVTQYTWAAIAAQYEALFYEVRERQGVVA